MKFKGLAFLGLLLAGFILRVWYIQHGLPVSFFADETKFVYMALNVGGGHLDTDLTFSLYPYLCFMGDALFIGLGKFLGLFKEWRDAWTLYKSNPTVYFVIARLISVLFSVGTIPVIYLIGKKMSGPRVGGLAAFFLAFSFLHIQYASVAFRDSTFVFFVMVSLLFAFQALERGHGPDFAGSGFFGGLAFSTKWSGPPLLVWGPLILFLRRTTGGKNFFVELFGKRDLLFFLCFAAGFTLGTPFWIFNFNKFLSQFIGGLNIFRPGGVGQMGRDSDFNWVPYLVQTLPEGLGWPLALASFFGMLMLLIRPRPAVILFLSFPLIYFAIAGSFVIHEARYMFPLVPFLALAAAHFLDRLVFLSFPRKPACPCPAGRRAAGRRESGVGIPRFNRGMTVLLGTLAVFLILPSLMKSLNYNYLKMTPDTQNLVHQWLQNNVPQESKFLVSCYVQPPRGWNFESLDPTVWIQEGLPSSLESVAEYKAEGIQYLVLDEWHLGMVTGASGRRPHDRETRQRYAEFLDQLKASAKLVATFESYDDPRFLFDRENVLFATRHLEKMKRFGPQVWVYQL